MSGRRRPIDTNGRTIRTKLREQEIANFCRRDKDNLERTNNRWNTEVLEKAYGKEINSVHSRLPPMKMPKNDEPNIVFLERDYRNIKQPHDDPLVIMLRIEEFNIHHVLIDNGSSTDIIYLLEF